MLAPDPDRSLRLRIRSHRLPFGGSAPGSGSGSYGPEPPAPKPCRGSGAAPCTNTACVDNDVKLEEFDSLFYDMPTNNNAVGSNFFGHKPTKQRKKKKSISNEILDEEDSSPSRQPGRPRSYKVEKTPAVQDGVRLCIFCNGHVRPQMCGGNKHRWRCVDKRCRKWYGWVRSNEEIPKDLGKKGRWKDLVLKVQGHTDDGKLVPMLPNQQEEVEVTDVKLKRTATTKKKRANNAPPPLSPLPEDRIAFQATPLEMRAHWWRPERKRVEPSPERDIEPGIVDTAAVMRLAEQSNRAASITTKSMEHSGRHQIDTGTATGFIDLMFDQIFASIGPLMALATNLPHMQKYNSNEIRADLFSTVENLPLLNP
uniref:GRF-type domain-containing protein n=1 Tax=Panagrellus redivivus TaxID=6233 RepID=A0A7E4WA79_PANRE